MQQDQPTGLGQPKIGQTTVKLGTPATGQASQLHAKAVFFC
jgi:hypothetical protein